MAYERGTKKESRLVQSSVAAGLPQAKHPPRAHPAGRRDLPEGVWQTWARTGSRRKKEAKRQASTRSGSARSVTSIGRSRSQHSQSERPNGTISLAASFRAGGSARGTMKFAVHVAKEASSVKITRGPDAGRFVWDVVVERANKESDLSHSAVTNFSSLSPAIYQIFRKVQAQQPAWIGNCVILLLPSADKRLAQCALPPGGLGKVPISKLAESVLDNWSPRRSVEHSLTPAQNSKRRRSPHVGTTVSQSRSFCSCSDEKLLMSNTYMRFVFSPMIHPSQASAREADPQTQVVENGSFAEVCEGRACSSLADEDCCGAQDAER